jgi:hypothetical protein
MRDDKHAVYSDGERYHCASCGLSWEPARPRRWWPIAFKWADYSSFGTHTIERNEAQAIERIYVATVLRVGRLRVVFGNRREPGK